MCGYCHAFKETKLITVTENSQINFPVVMSHGYAGDGSTFVPVIQVPGLAVIQRKAEPELGAMEKVMAFSVFDSWPIMAISAVLTILAALLIWFLVSMFLSITEKIHVGTMAKCMGCICMVFLSATRSKMVMITGH